MVIITKEEYASRVFRKYKNVAAFSLAAKGAKAYSDDKVEISYEKLNFLPDEDTINAIKGGDTKLKKVIKKACKALNAPSMDAEKSTVGLGMTQLITLITSARKSKKGPAVIVFVEDETDAERSKIIRKYLTALLGEYGIVPVRDKKIIKRLFKGKRKKIIEAVTKFQNTRKNRQVLTKRGAELKKLNHIFYALELHQSGMIGLEASDLDSGAARTCVKTLLRTFTAENLRMAGKASIAKKLAKKDKAAVKAYKTLRDILLIMNPDLKLPKVSYGQKKKKKKAVGPKMNVKKFRKFFEKKRNRHLLLVIYGHSLAMLLGFEPGCKEYNSHMKEVCANIKDDFGKTFVVAANQYHKDHAPAA